MASDYDGFNDTDLAHHISIWITQRTGRVWNATATERLAAWLADSGNRSTAVHWLEYVGEVEKPPIDPTEEFEFRKPMENVLTEDRGNEPPGFEARERRWRLPLR